MIAAVERRGWRVFKRVRYIAEALVVLVVALALLVLREGSRTQTSQLDRRLAALTMLAAAAAVASLAASRGAIGPRRWFWIFVTAASVAWDPARAVQPGAGRLAHGISTGDMAIGVGLFAIAIGLAIHTTTSSSDRQRLALDLIPQMIGLTTIAWIGWIGPQALGRDELGWSRLVVAGHGLADVLLIGLCSAGIIGRRQGVASDPPVPLLVGVVLIALGDAVALPVWERWAGGFRTGSHIAIGAGFLLIGAAAIRSRHRPERLAARPNSSKNASTWASQMPNLVLIGLLALAIVQAIVGQRVPGAIATSVAAGVIVIVFGMIRQALTLRHEKRLHQEIDQLSAQIDNLVSQVGRDPLTGLLNHRAVHDRLAQEIDGGRANGAAVAVALIDVDNFKTVNDRRGHQAGDRVLRAISSILIAACRTSDVAARYAGDEFILILPGLDEAHAASVCERIISDVRRINRDLNLGKEVEVTLSVGVAVSHVCGRGAQRIIGVADAAMYDAKEAGKDRVVVVNADTMVAIGGSRIVNEIPSGGLPLMQTVPRLKDRRRFGRVENAS